MQDEILFADFYHAQELPAQISTLRSIQNDLTGHELRKLSYVRKGLIPAIHDKLLQLPVTLDETESLQQQFYVQAANVICVLAHGGPTYVYPILNNNILDQFLLHLRNTSSFVVVLPILRCLNAVADNLPLSSSHEWNSDRRLSQLLYSGLFIGYFPRFIGQTSNTPISQQVSDTTLALLCKTCHDERHKSALVEAGVLSALSYRLASFVVSDGLVLSHHDTFRTNHIDNRTIPQPAASNAHLSPVLESIGVLIEHSQSNANNFISDASILAVLPSSTDDFSPSDIRKTPWGGHYLSGVAVPRSRAQNALEILLPSVPDKLHEADHSSFPPLGMSMPMPKRRSSSIRGPSDTPVMTVPEDAGEDQDESMVVPWLLHTVRASQGKRRLMAAKLIAILHHHELVSSARVRSFAILLVPILVQMLDQDHDSTTIMNERMLLCTGMHFAKAVPSVLATLISDSELLQRAAFEAKAILKLSALLKKTFDDAENNKIPLWQPQKGPVNATDGPEHSALGVGGPSQNARHTMLFREGLLQALAAIAPSKESYRTEICDQGTVVQIMLALEPFQASIATDRNGNTVVVSGNSASTLLAACGAVRALTRSVTALRTKLVDADVAKSIVRLLNNPEPLVRVAATKVIANLALDFSPMKQSVSETALIKKLCEQAHSANAKLRLESIFALTNLVNNSPLKIRRDVIDTLGANWIRHLIATDPYDIPPGEVIGLVERDYRKGSFARLTNDTSGDVEMNEDQDKPVTSVPSAPADFPTDREYNIHTIADDILIQEQILALIRNLTCGTEAFEIVDYLLGEIGQDDFFRILLDRLRPRSTTGATRKVNQISSTHKNTLIHTLCILSHVAATGAKYRNLIAGHTGLVKELVNLCSHREEMVRAQICWVVISLLDEDDISQKTALQQRALDLRAHGLLNHMNDLETRDSYLDVKERAKTAVVMFNSCLGA